MTDYSSASIPARRISLLRLAMKKSGVNAALVPSSDPHMSEYLPAHWRGREWLSGFTGSAGTLIVTADFAGLWTDSRYWSQAEDELRGSGIVVMRANSSATPTYIAWLKQNLRTGQTVYADGMVLSLHLARQIEQALLEGGLVLRTEGDMIGDVWTDRPPLPMKPVFAHEARYAPISRAEKLAEIRSAMQAQKAEWHFISALDDIAWLFNLRGSDVDFNPVFISHALVGMQRTVLFVAKEKLTKELQGALAADGVELMPYEDAIPCLSGLKQGETLLLDPRRVSLAVWQAVTQEVSVTELVNPSTLAKSRKHAAELAQVRLTMEQDGVMLCEFFAWLERTLSEGRSVTELEVGERILSLRERLPRYVSPSFDTIAGFNANGALPHYRATQDKHANISGDGLLLIDTGGQYLGGTTDITRTVPIGQPSAEQKRDFTLVLKGLIALSSAHFPRSMRAPMLDAIARAPLWAQGMDYGHGTGHGVGYFLNVHEGPQSISCHAAAESYTAMEEGMITSIEPAVYRPGKWGVRIENLSASRAAEETEFGDFLRFETLTLCPIDTRCVEPSLMRDDEIAWLNDYHAIVRERLLPHVQGQARAWLLSRTEPM